jgi:hypothetical protein
LRTVRATRKTARTVPRMVELTMKIDLGADRTLIEADVMRSLGLAPSRIVESTTFNTLDEPKQREEFQVGLSLERTDLAPRFRLAAVAGKFAGNPFQGLLGMDFLRLCVLAYDGPGGRFVLAY